MVLWCRLLYVLIQILCTPKRSKELETLPHGNQYFVNFFLSNMLNLPVVTRPALVSNERPQWAELATSLGDSPPSIPSDMITLLSRVILLGQMIARFYILYDPKVLLKGLCTTHFDSIFDERCAHQSIPVLPHIWSFHINFPSSKDSHRYPI